MLIVRGVNVFPSAVREVVHAFAPRVSGNILVRPRAPGVKQDPPLPVTVELARDARPDDALAAEIRDRLRSVLVVQTQVELVPWGSLQRSEYEVEARRALTQQARHVLQGDVARGCGCAAVREHLHRLAGVAERS